MSKAELVELAQRIINGEGTEEEHDRLMRLFSANVPHPAGANLIYWPEHSTQRDDVGAYDPTPEEVVEQALNYKPIML